MTDWQMDEDYANWGKYGTTDPEPGQLSWREKQREADEIRRAFDPEAERDALAETLRAARDYVDVQWGRAEQAAEQVNRIPAAGVAQAFADLADILGSDE